MLLGCSEPQAGSYGKPRAQSKIGASPAANKCFQFVASPPDAACGGAAEAGVSCTIASSSFPSRNFSLKSLSLSDEHQYFHFVAYKMYETRFCWEALLCRRAVAYIFLTPDIWFIASCRLCFVPSPTCNAGL